MADLQGGVGYSAVTGSADGLHLPGEGEVAVLVHRDAVSAARESVSSLPVRPSCSIPSCPNIAQLYGFCTAHYYERSAAERVRLKAAPRG